MSRVFYIGGFGNGSASAERVCEALESHFEDPHYATFSDAMKMKEEGTLHRAAKGVRVITHSSGMLPLTDTQPEVVDAFNPPIPTPRLRLIARTLAKTIHMHTPGKGIRSMSDAKAAAQYDLSSVAELAVHPIGNLQHLKDIALFNAIAAAKDAIESGIHTRLAYTHEDAYFPLVEDHHFEALQAGVGITMLDGVHDELVLRPEAVLDKYYQNTNG